MRASSRATVLGALLLVASGWGCRKQEALAPWLTMPSVKAHAHWFPTGPSDVHGAPVGQSPACDSCHLDKGSGLPSTTFQTWTCTGCHVAVRPGLMHDVPADLITLHAAVPEYAGAVAAQAPNVAASNGGAGPQTAEDGACRGCHPTGWAVDHAKVFPLPHQDAAGLQVATCFDCHLDAANRSSLGCSACHPHDAPATATAHASVPDFQAAGPTDPQAAIVAASTRCARCHGDATVPVTVAGHAAASAGFVLAGAHVGTAGGACLDCHPALRADRAFAADFKAFTCGAACHGAVPMTSAGAHDDPVALGTFHAAAAADFTGTVSAQGFDAACRSCHPAGTVGLPADHPFPVGAAPGHPLGTCASCHTTTTARNDPANLACGTCHLALDASLAAKHAQPASAIPVTDYAATNDRCLYCHGDAQVNWTVSHPTGEDTPSGNGAHLTAGCSGCHGVARTDKPFAADWGSRTCVTATCHPTGVPTGQ